MISTLEQMIRRDRLAAVLCVTVITALAWTSLVRMSSRMTAAAVDPQMTAAMGASHTQIWGAAEWLSLSGMWAVMMVGMMLPLVSPVLLHMLQLYRRRGDHLARQSAAAFVGGHLVAWSLFSALAAAAQLGLHRAAMLDTGLTIRSTVLTGAVLLAVGVYQFLPVKSACLTHCRPPLQFLSMKRREGTRGAFTMGLQYGGFCVGCCGALMALMFVVGVMNLLWVAALTVLVLLEKIAPLRVRVEYVSGVTLIVWGVTELVRS
jgi:predicted metal-binding membrane protein